MRSSKSRKPSRKRPVKVLTKEQLLEREQKAKEIIEERKLEEKVMEKEFEELLDQLNEKRSLKNEDFYAQILEADYGDGKYKNFAPTSQLVDQKNQGLKNKIRNSILMT